VNINQLSKLIIESVHDEQKRQIDEFINEFQGFDLKFEKKRLKSLTRQLIDLQSHACSELFSKDKTEKTQSFLKRKREIQELKDKIAKYEQNKPVIDCYAASHSQYMLHKHNKIT